MYIYTHLLVFVVFNHMYFSPYPYDVYIILYYCRKNEHRFMYIIRCSLICRGPFEKDIVQAVISRY